jgi:DNA topoisomerase-1
METAKFDRNTITITTEDGGTICKSSGSVLKFDGFLKVFPSPSKDEDEAILPEMSKGPINIESLIDEQHFTQPPPRYSEASLGKKIRRTWYWQTFNLCKYHIYNCKPWVCRNT